MRRILLAVGLAVTIFSAENGVEQYGYGLFGIRTECVNVAMGGTPDINGNLVGATWVRSCHFK